MNLYGKLGTLIAATAIIWLCVGAVVLINAHEIANAGALILAVLATITLWSLWALDHIGINVDGTPREMQNIVPREKAKREVDEDAQLALLLSLLTPDERDALKARLLNELDGDGEIPLADLLAEQEPDTASSEHT